MNFVTQLKQRARTLNKSIVLPEASDERYIEAIKLVAAEQYATIIMLGDPAQIQPKCETYGVPRDSYTIVDYKNAPQFKDYVHSYYELRKHKGITEQQAEEVLSDPLYYADMMVREGEADGCLAGAVNSTANVIRASLQIIGTAKNTNTISSYFIMVMPDSTFVEEGVFFYADCGAVPQPTAEQLADIAISTADTRKLFMESEPRVALLSFSTKGSAEHPDVDKVRQTLQIIQEKRPDLNVDGEMQFDAAVIDTIGKKKAPGSTVAGQANILIFPDLDAGNIAYKITERLGGAVALGPCIQGLAKSAMDLSRGCNAQDISIMIAITAIQAS
jgi:phosphate acetyltransferase